MCANNCISIRPERTTVAQRNVVAITAHLEQELLIAWMVDAVE